VEDKMFDLPYGVSLDRKQSSRACYFECNSKEAKEELIDILDDRGINWQDEDSDEYESKSEEEGNKKHKKHMVW